MKSVSIVLLCGAVVLCNHMGVAQIPRTISNQGFYTSNGQPVTATYPMTFKLFTQKTGGSLTWSQTFASVQITKGVYSVVLSVDSVVFDRQYWLETVINGVTGSTRTQLTGVPYSLAPWTPRDSSVYFGGGGNVGIGTATPIHRLSIAGGPPWTSNFWKGTVNLEDGSAIAWPANGGGQRFGIGHSGGGFYTFRTASDPGSSASPALYDFVIDDAGNVGIGTTAPFAKLHVNGYGYFRDGLGGALETGWGQELNIDKGCDQCVPVVGGRFKVTVNGDVGIGTNSPAGVGAAGPVLHMKGTLTTVPEFKLDATVAGGHSYVLIADASAGSPLYVQDQTSGTIPFLIAGDDGHVNIKALQILGGSDLSENFDVRGSEPLSSDAAPAEVRTGMVVAIDPENPGKLVVSHQAYDRRVAGVVSGAGGIKPGMVMGQAGSLANGALPVALSGRVYCLVDASLGAIEPGDLLTTSGTPGYAMKATDHARAQGAVIGKAMTGLKQGKGLILLLVNLQ